MMNRLGRCILYGGFGGLATLANAEFPPADPTNPPQSLPAGYETFFPAGYTAPKMSVSNGAVAIVGPTPFFKPRGFNSSTTGVRNTQVGATGGGGDPPVVLQDGNTELMLAAATGDVEKTRHLLEQGARVDVRNRFGSTALMGAAAGGHSDIVAMLLSKGASANVRGRGGVTALMYAAKNGHAETVTILLNHGADARLKNNEGRTAALLATEQGFDEIAKALENPDAQPSVSPPGGLP